MRAVVMGVPGAGKTSVVKKLTDEGWKMVTFGTVMLEVAKEEFGIKDRDEMRDKIPASEYGGLQLEAAKRIGQMSGNIIVDTHCSIEKPEGYYPGLPMDVLRLVKPDAFIVVEADPEEIRMRREKDAGKRKRPKGSREHQEVNRYYVSAYSAISGAPVAFIRNEQGKLDEARSRVREILSRVEVDG